MNDPHDNAATDKEMLRRFQTDQAIEAFGKVAMKAIQLEMAEYALTKLLNGTTDTDRYFEETEQIRHRMELKRAEYARLGKLPKEETQSAEEIIQDLRDQLAETKMPDAPYAEQRCDTCRKVHKPPEVVGAGGVKFWPGHEYIIRTKTTMQRYPREWRMGYLGFGNGMEWSARGPDRTHGGQYGGTQTMDLRDIVYAEEVERDDAKRHVGELYRGDLVGPWPDKPTTSAAHDRGAGPFPHGYGNS